MSVPQWNADIITPEEEGSGTKVLDGNQVVQPTLEGGTNITISDGTISATGGGAEYYAGEGIVISNENAISITETVRDGAALGATSVQPADLSGYVLASSLAAVATSGDFDDLLDKPTIPTVDQTYNAASTNAQSGTAVAQAIAAIPSASYTAGDGIDITAGEISVKAGTGLEISDTTSTTESSLYETSDSEKYVRGFAPLTADLFQLIQSSSGLTITTKITYNALIGNPSTYYCCLFSRLAAGGYFDKYLKLKATTPADLQAGSVITFNISDLDTSGSNTTIEYVQNHLGDFHIGLMGMSMFGSWDTPVYLAGSSYSEVETATYPTTVTITDALCVSNPLPASSASDEDKVLTVNSYGTPVWAAAQGGTQVQSDWTEADPSDPSYVQHKPDVLSFVAGSRISITESASSITIAADAQIPSYSTTTDVGKVLQVTANGLAWVSLS